MEKHETYSVLITDDQGRRGTGTLFYTEGASSFYVLTCAHVIYTAQSVTIHLLVPTKEDPKEYTVVAEKNQFHFSPIDQVTVIGNQSTHTCDVAVIVCAVGDIPLSPTRYAIYPMTSGEEVIAIGYPQGAGHLYYQQSSLYATVEKVLKNQPYFLIRLKNESNINSADRESELRGFSGAPLWDEEKLNEGNYLFGGLIAIGLGTNIRQGRIGVTSGKHIQELLQNDFGISIASRIPGITEDEIAPGYEAETETEDQIVVRSSWVENERKKAQTYVNTLQLKKAIEVAKAAIANSEFQKCTVEQKYSIYAVLLGAYRLGQEYEIYDQIKEEMHAAGIQNDSEAKIDAVRYYEAQQIDQAEACIKKALAKNPNGNEEKVIYTVIRATKDPTADISILSELLGPRDQLLIQPKNEQEEETIYQILGFSLANRFRETGRAIRCLNRSFQIGGNYIILESLAVTYYQHSMRQAVIDVEKDRVDPRKIDLDALEKARDAFLRVLSAADEMWTKGTFHRVGLQLFKCFVFLHDHFRIYKHYQDLIRFCPFDNQEIKRDVQLCYIETILRKEPIHLDQFDAITAHDKKFYELVLLLDQPMQMFDGGLAVDAPITEKQLQQILEEGEQRLQELVETQTDDRLNFDGIRTALINLYGNGMLRYRWQAMAAVKKHFANIQNPDGKEALQIYQEELETDQPDLIEQKFEALFEKRRDVLSFMEWIHFYIRHDRLEKVKELYESVFHERNYLIHIQPEYFYRSYMAFIMHHRFDLTPAIRCLVENRNEFKDIFIYKSFEMDLKFATCTLNDPETMLEDARVLWEEGLYSQTEYHEKCLIINMLNGKPEIAETFAGWANGNQVPPRSIYEQILLIWKGAKVMPNPHWNCMQKWNPDQLFARYREEQWLRNPEDILRECHTAANRTVVVDLWTLYFFVKSELSEMLNLFHTIYVTHSSVSAALQEIEHVNDGDIRSVLSHLITEKNIKFLSPTLEQQLNALEPNNDFMEIHHACLLAQELNCPALVGEFRFPIPERLQSNVIRLNALKHVIDCLNAANMLEEHR